MRRREFIQLIGGAAAAWPVVARGQQSTRILVVGFLVPGSQASHGAWVAAFGQRMSELGWSEGRNITIEHRWAVGDNQRMTEFAAEFVQRKVDVIVSSANGVRIARQATSSIPIVFAAFGDPVAAGLAVSLARPGGNATGLTVQPSDLAGKRIGLLREIIPNFRRLSALTNVASTNFSEAEGIRTAAAAFGIEAKIFEIRTSDDIATALANLKGTDALYVLSEPLVNAYKAKIIETVTAEKIPTVFGFREFVDAGGLMSYGPNFSDLFRRAADFADKILRGPSPPTFRCSSP
ncbi:ABC transporter substrate-binding protein [Bradyrhizobium lablabi]|nr:ABC transporter substrate-binding protein [Bradyrhizobium lablabi]MBR1123071.1 ABC transporter substrate-binding protein [Bradyrhizobium lablabi]